MKKIHQDVWCGSILLALVIFAYVTSRDFAQKDVRSIIMPYIAMSVISLLACVIIADGVKKTIEAAKKGEYPKQYFTLENMKIPLTTFAFIIGYIVLFHYVGYMLASVLFLVGLMLFLKMRDWKVITIIVVVYMLIVYFGFYRGLHINIVNFGELQYMLE